MPRVHYVKKARKDNPAVKAGEPYYWWKFRYGGKRYSTKRPRPSQLTQAKYAAVLEAEESVQDAVAGGATVSELTEVLEEAASQVREVAEEYLEAADSQREYFPDSEVAQENEDKSYHYETIADEIDDAVADLQGMDEDDQEDAEARIEDIGWDTL